MQVWDRANCSVARKDAGCDSHLSGVQVKVDGVKCGVLGGSRSIQTIVCNKIGSRVVLAALWTGVFALCEVKVYAGFAHTNSGNSAIFYESTSA